MKLLLSEYQDSKLNSSEFSTHSMYISMLQKINKKLSELSYADIRISNYAYRASSIHSSTCGNGDISITYQWAQCDMYDVCSVEISGEDLRTIVQFRSIFKKYSEVIRDLINLTHEYVKTLEDVVNILEYEIFDAAKLLKLAEEFRYKKEDEMIMYPEMRRGELCTNFVAVSNWSKLSRAKKGDIISLKRNHKNSKEKDYIIKGINEDYTIAVIENGNKNGKLLFLQNINRIAEAWDCLCYENKIKLPGWWNRKYEYIPKKF